MAFPIRYAPLVLLFAGVTATHAQAKLEVKPDRQNVAAARLIGDWEPDAALTTRLGGTALSGASNSADPRVGGMISFRSDPGIAGLVPDAMAARLLSMTPPIQVFAAGLMTMGGKEHPFLLVAFAGNPSVLYFRERNGERFGDGESFLMALTPAKEPANDLLFIGGDFNNQPFSAFRRVGSPATRGSSPAPSR